MKRVCAWCNKNLGAAASEICSEEAITHGICAECIDKMFVLHGSKITDFLDGLEAPVAVVDPEGRVCCANGKAQKLLHKERFEIEGFKGGDVFECAYAKLEGGCGNTIHCDGCTIRTTVMDTFATGKDHLKTPASLVHGTIEDYQEISFLISTEKVKDVVLLRIDRMGNY